MRIPEAFRDRFLYHFTPLENLPSILAHGLLSAHEQKRLGLPQRSLVWAAIQSHRETLQVPVGVGGYVQEYVPLYFCKLSPMLLAIISNKVVDEQAVIHFEFPISVLEQLTMVFTDAATMPNVQPSFYTQLNELMHLNWEAIDSPAWRMPNPELRHARLAEALIHLQVPVELATRIIVWDHRVERQVQAMYEDFHCAPPRIEIDPGAYFVYRSEMEVRPAISGPTQIYHAFQRTVARLRSGLQQRSAAPHFADLRALRDALRQDFCALPETAELYGLETDNKAHFEDVGSHTRRVVAELRKTREYQLFSDEDQVLLELTAFLHDIGKGPKSRWAEFGGRQQVDADHPIRALPMLERIFTQEVAQVRLEDALLISKLICYHDLVGGILYSGRRLSELLNVITSERELDMLIGLGKADSTAINPAWMREELRMRLREAVMHELNRPKTLHPFS